MSSIIVHTNNPQELDLLKNILKKMKYSFETISEEKQREIKVSDGEMKSILRGLEQANNGVLSDSIDVHQKAKKLYSK
ncbi:MAG: hypothetical protein Q4A00_06585 [Flavobacteriaceae bacterium]|nr:hypothetical protein [Flavobacteriaceae bacterium]